MSPGEGGVAAWKASISANTAESSRAGSRLELRKLSQRSAHLWRRRLFGLQALPRGFGMALLTSNWRSPVQNNISRAKTQRRKEKPLETRQRFAPLRLCGRNIFFSHDLKVTFDTCGKFRKLWAKARVEITGCRFCAGFS